MQIYRILRVGLGENERRISAMNIEASSMPDSPASQLNISHEPAPRHDTPRHVTE